MVAEEIQTGAVLSDHELESLYRETFPVVAGFIAKAGGSADDASDIFQDALIIFFEQSAKRTLTASPAAYIVGIAKHLWNRRFRSKAQFISLDDFELGIHIADEEKHTPLFSKIYGLIERSGNACLQLLEAFYYRQFSPTKIADDFGFSSAHSASAQKFKCIEKLRNVVKEKSLSYEDFLE